MDSLRITRGEFFIGGKRLKLIVLKECGYQESLLGISLSYNADMKDMPRRAMRLAHMGGGHSKFLESIMVWLDITGSRAWWSQFDTYRVATKQSESTMHTLLKKPLTQESFFTPLPQAWLDHLNEQILVKDVEFVKNLLPEGFLQRRIVCASYKTLQNIFTQRSEHKLSEWRTFVASLLGRLEYPEFISKAICDKSKEKG